MGLQVRTVVGWREQLRAKEESLQLAATRSAKVKLAVGEATGIKRVAASPAQLLRGARTHVLDIADIARKTTRKQSKELRRQLEEVRSRLRGPDWKRLEKLKRAKERRERNPEKVKAYWRAWRAKNKDKVREKSARDRVRYAAQYKAYRKARYGADPEEANRKASEWAKANRDRRREQWRRWYEKAKRTRSAAWVKLQERNKRVARERRDRRRGGPVATVEWAAGKAQGEGRQARAVGRTLRPRGQDRKAA